MLEEIKDRIEHYLKTRKPNYKMALKDYDFMRYELALSLRDTPVYRIDYYRREDGRIMFVFPANLKNLLVLNMYPDGSTEIKS